MIRSLDKKWKEFLFAFSGFGPNLLMVLMGSYYSDALNPAALESGEQFQAILPGVCFILPALFPILYTLGKFIQILSIFFQNRSVIGILFVSLFMSDFTAAYALAVDVLFIKPIVNELSKVGFLNSIFN